MGYKLPEFLENEEGEIRKVGLEFEYGSTDLDTSARCIIDLYGGKCVRTNKFSQKVKETSLGDFSLKVDADFLNSGKYKKSISKIGMEALSDDLDNIIDSITSIWIPYEITTPPVPVTELEELDKLREALHVAHAQGTDSSVLKAYAMHINPEIPAFNTYTILNYLRAFLLLYHWLKEKSQVDKTRSASGYIDPFPENYVKKILNPAYSPGREELIKDYKKYNPDRNRPLDLYPLFGWLNPDSVTGVPAVKPRPTFHFRLPNCLIDKPGWSIASEWNCWLIVEDLASKPKEIEELSKHYLNLSEQTFIGFKKKWKKVIDERVKC